MSKMVVVQLDDWCGIYVHGKLEDEGHLDETLMIQEIKPEFFPIEKVEFIDAYEDEEEVLGERWRMPETLQEVLDIVEVDVPAEFFE